MADLLSGLSQVADLGFGFAAGESVRSCALATLLARSLQLPEDDVRAVYYTALLEHIGCTGYAHETARAFGDEYALNAAAARLDEADPKDLFATFLPVRTAGRPPLQRVRLAATALAQGRRFARAYITATCEVGRDVARRLRLPEQVQRGVYHAYEEWHGGGFPGGLAGEDIPLASRIAQLTGIGVLFDTLGGPEASATAVRRRAGGTLDPRLAEHFAARATALLAELGAADPRDLILQAEPLPPVTVPEPQLIEAAGVFADVADLKSPVLHGHSRQVGALAVAAADRMRMPEGERTDVHLAGLLHDLGRVAVPTRVWGKPGALSGHETDQARLHSYHSERIVAGSRRLAPIARVVGMHHERLDGSGYHRGCRGSEIPVAARVVAAADCYQAMTQDRPYRAGLSPEQAADRLLAECRDGALDPDAVHAVLAAAGHRRPRRAGGSPPG